MRYSTLKRIDAQDNLAHILNAYMGALSTVDRMSLPRETMGEYMRLFNERSSPQKREMPASEAYEQLSDWREPRFFMLQVLSNSLNDWHKNIIWAIELLTKFFDEYDGDLTRYAVERRRKIIDEHGSDDASDWEEDGVDEQGEQKRKVAYKENAVTLARYSLAREIDQYFTGSEGGGEKIGTSHAPDYAYFTNLVRRETEFSPFKLARKFYEEGGLSLHVQNEAGEMVEQSLGDALENELSLDIINAHAVAWFELALEQSNHCVFLQAFATTSDHYRELLAHLIRVRDLDFPEPEVKIEL